MKYSIWKKIRILEGEDNLCYTSHMKTAKNTWEPDNLEITQKIEEILTREDMPGVDMTLMKKLVGDVLHGDKSKALHVMESADVDIFQYLPDSLKCDKDVVIKALRKKGSIFGSLPLEMKKNIDIQSVALESMISSWESIITIISVIESWDKKNYKTLRELLSRKLWEKKDYFTTPLSKLIYEVFENDTDLYRTIKEKHFLTNNGNISLSGRFTSILAKAQEGLESSTPDELQEKLMNLILKFLGISKWSLSKQGRALFENIISGISIAQKWEDDEQEDDQEGAEISNDNEDEEEGPEIDYSVWPYSYSDTGSSFTVWDDGGNSVNLESEVFNNISEKSLENFMNFSALTKNLGLGFLVEKHARLSQLVTKVNFYDGEGMSEARILKFLNSVGKNIGIPEESYEDSEGNKKVGCFNNLGATKMHFREVKNTGKIGNLDIDPAKKWDKTIIEIYMKYSGLLVPPFDEISVAKWK